MNGAALTPVWKALSDPTRRGMLDLLRERPLRTGDLSASFEVSRFAVMKHLAVLESAGLVTARRTGRERWNHLNAVPLQRIYERWLRPYEGQWAASLIRLQEVAEDSATTKGELHMPTTAIPVGEVNTIQIEQEIRVDAPPAKVFDALTGDVSAWWGAPYLQSAPHARKVVLEAKPGGRFYEEWSNDEGAIWGFVTNIKKNERIIMNGAMAWSGNVQGLVRFDLEEDGGATVVRFTHKVMGEVDDEMRTAYSGGWEDLLGRRLKTFVETGEKMGIGHEPPME
jgi:uncharacterized protein YndB with AHSA1/START domain/DNA-binding transcriptional ArsR family regulator